MSLKPRARGQLKQEDEDTFILVNKQGRQFVADPTVGIVWKLCDGNRTIKDITAVYTGLLSLSAERDLVDLRISETLDTLYENGLIR